MWFHILNKNSNIIIFDIPERIIHKLREEVKKQNVAVTAILPGAMPTRDDIKEQIKGQGLWGRLAVKSPQAVFTAK